MRICVGFLIGNDGVAPKDVIETLERAVDELRFNDISPIVESLTPTDFSDNEAKALLGLLRRKRQFSDLERAASLFTLAGNNAPVVRRQWAQALIDQDRVEQGLCALEAMRRTLAADDDERPEVEGLIGRAHKQRYINHGGEENLIRAISAYRPNWQNRKGDYRWHGINMAALLSRAKKDNVDPIVDDDPRDIAKALRDEIESLPNKDTTIWDAGTAMEASVALGDNADALNWAKRYVSFPKIDAFELASTLRQMKEVWQLDGTELGRKLLPVLECELLQKEGATLEPTTTRIEDTGGFEAVYGPESHVRLRWIDTMYRACHAIARVFNTATGEPFGTGFLIKGSKFNAAWGDDAVFFTNAHVVSPSPADEAQIAPGSASAEFTKLDGRPTVELGELLYTSPRVEYDISVFAIEPPANAETLEPSYYPPAPAQPGQRPQRIYIIGHPKGGDLAVSLYDNSLVGCAKCRAHPDGENCVHYKTPTEGGSSGSPVFNREWKPFAIHHRAVDDLEVNEGILFEPIKMALSP